MNDLQAARVFDADFEIVGGPYRVGEEHRRERGWFFTGHYDSNGDPLFISQELIAKKRVEIADWRWIKRWIFLPIAALAVLVIVVSLFQNLAARP